MKWNEIIRTAQEAGDRSLADGSIAWFRGQRDASYELRSTLHRYIARLFQGMKEPPSGEAYVDILRKEYKTLFRRFKADAWPFLDERARSDWGIIFTMQHYGLPTRLLDWTESFACAIFFAQLCRDPHNEATLWILDPQALNRYAIGEAAFVALDDSIGEAKISSHLWHPKYVTEKEPLSSIAGAPIYTNSRMTAQRAAFTVSGDSPLPLNQEFPELVASGQLVKLDLPPETFQDAEQFLQLAGLNSFSFYPDLHGLALRHEAATEQKIADYRRLYPDAFEP